MFALLVIALATFTAVMGLRALLPFALPTRLMPVILPAVAWGVEWLSPRYYRAVEALAVAGLVVIIHRFAVTQDPEPWGARIAEVWRALRPRPRIGRPTSPVGRRVPRL
jgi:MFS superfamily sulfate permease-like transporter